jgi:acid phosphatase class B
VDVEIEFCGAASVVTFDVDFSADAARSDVLLLALVHHRTEPVTLAAGDLRSAVLASSHAAVRSLRVVRASRCTGRPAADHHRPRDVREET